MIGSINIRVNAAQPNKQLCDLFAFQGSPSSIRVLDVPRSIGDWEITSVKLVVAYPNNNTVERVATRVGNVWVATIEGCAICGKVESGYEILADGVDEQGNPVEGYVLGKGNVFVLENSIDVERLVSKFTVRYLKNLPDIPCAGDLVEFNGVMKLYDGQDWISMGGDVNDTTITIQKNGVEVGSFTTNASEATTIDIPVPSTTSELENDSGFITSSDIPAIPSQTSDLVNDSGFITASAIPSTVSSFENDVGYITASAIPPIPSQTSDLVNDSGYITASAIPPIPSTTNDLLNDSGFITASAIPSQVSAFENNVGYITASDIPPIPSKTSELDNDSGFITSSDIPAIPSQTSDLVNDSGFITSSAIPSNVGAFNNDVGYLTASTMPPIPSQTSDLENDSGFITLSAIPAIPSNTSDLVNNSGFITASAIPSNVGAFNNDVGYVTSSEVEPASQNIWGGFAEQAYYAARLWMYTDQLARGVPNTANYLIYQGAGGVKTRKISQYPWTLTKYYTTTFDPGVELQFKYIDSVSVYVGGRIRSASINAWGWIYSPNSYSHYIIKGTMPYKETFSIHPTHIAYISGSTTVTWHEIGLSSNVLSIETVDGESGQVVCTRTSSSVIDTEINTLAYTSQIPTTTSQLTNNSGFITASTVASSYYNKTEIDGMIGSINTILDNINGEVI